MCLIPISGFREGGVPSLFSDHQIDEERFKNVEFHDLSEARSNLTGFKKYPSQK